MPPAVNQHSIKTANHFLQCHNITIRQVIAIHCDINSVIPALKEHRNHVLQFLSSKVGDPLCIERMNKLCYCIYSIRRDQVSLTSEPL